MDNGGIGRTTSGEDPVDLAALRALPPEHEVFPGLAAADLIYAMSPDAPEDVRSGTAHYRDGADEPQHVHWCAPADPGPHPAVLLVHSGSWGGGDATMYLRYATDLARRGFVAASVNYRLTPQARWPEPLVDVCAAVAWLRADPLGMGVAPSAVAVAGGSAGAHLAAMSVLAPTPPLQAGDVAAAVLWYPPLRLSTMARLPGAGEAVEGLLGSLQPAVLDAASPISHVSAQCPPLLTLTGDDDPICTEQDARDFHAALTRAGVSNEVVVVRGGPHGFDLTRRWYRQSLERVVGFLDSTLRGH